MSSGESRFGLVGSYLKTDQNFDKSGEKTDLTDSGSFSSLAATGFFRYALGDRFSIGAEADFVLNKVAASTNSQTIDTSAGGPSDVSAMLRYDALIEPVRLYIDAGVQIPSLYTRPSAKQWSELTTTSDVPRGTGASEYNATGTLEIPFAKNFYGGAGVGYTMRSAGFSNLIPYRLFLKYEKPQGLFARGGVRGQLTAGNDLYASNTAAKERSLALIAGSQAYNAINPTFLQAEATLGAHLSKNIYLAFGGALPLRGSNVPASPVLFAGFGVHLGVAASGSEYTHSNRGFQEYYFEARVIQVNNKLKALLMDKGLRDNVRVGEILDVFAPNDQEGQFGATVARGKVTEIGPTRSKLQILEVFNEVHIQEGFVVRRPVR